MKKENTSYEEKPKANEMQFDDDLEGFYSVTKNVVKITDDPGNKKAIASAPILFNGEKPYCEGNYKFVNGKKYLFVTVQSKSGLVPADALTKL